MNGSAVRLAPADVRGPQLQRPVRRGLAWWKDGTLYVATGRPDDPVVDAYDTGDATPARVGRGFTVGTFTVTSCGCSSPWKRVDPEPLEQLAVRRTAAA